MASEALKKEAEADGCQWTKPCESLCHTLEFIFEMLDCLLKL